MQMYSCALTMLTATFMQLYIDIYKRIWSDSDVE